MEFGWALPKREEYVRDAEPRAVETSRIRFLGDYMTRPLFPVPIGLPKYRLKNGRTISLQAEWLAEHPAEPTDFFRVDPESERAQEEQHSLLLKLIPGRGLEEFFGEPRNKQIEPLILDSHGFVINGNRRLCCWREYYESDRAKYEHLSHVRVIVLPPADERAIDRLEAELQVTQDIREDYTWDTLANMMSERREQHGYTDDELADLYDKKVTEVRELLEMRDYALQYMTSRGKPHHWTMVRGRGTDYAFRKILKARKLSGSALDKRIIENVSFTLLDDAEGLGRLYEAIPKLGEHLPKLKERLREELPVATEQTGASSDPTGFFGDELSGEQDAALARALEDERNRDIMREVARDIIEEGRIQDAEERNASYVRKKLQRANAEVQAAIHGINDTSAQSGVREQIAAIEKGLAAIRKWLDGNS